jgi:hypothetical protein
MWWSDCSAVAAQDALPQSTRQPGWAPLHPYGDEVLARRRRPADRPDASIRPLARSEVVVPRMLAPEEREDHVRGPRTRPLRQPVAAAPADDLLLAACVEHADSVLETPRADGGRRRVLVQHRDRVVDTT